MTWNFDRSLERARRKYEEASDVEVTKLTREMDFQNISLKKAKRVHGAHLYTDLPNFGAIVKNAFGGDEAELLRRLHILNRELTRGVEKDLPAAKVHFQGPRLHAVAYRPIDNDTEIAVLAVIAA